MSAAKYADRILEFRSDSGQCRHFDRSCKFRPSSIGNCPSAATTSRSPTHQSSRNVQLQRTQFNRTQQLVSQGAIARQESDVARNNLQSAIADLQVAEEVMAI
ncbi:hypothetical protein LC608_29255 [Nostoc sp. XA010]|uniref:hypothetical protein n=1 Tax=Nostoc sp. XA010 TaxID=2780407 RepID=UPI001E28290B|nr:hypothetical protein [Nostoc sp. XA010]MCC5660988.1 hypothetical protein [Nostoc sp. XA010]